MLRKIKLNIRQKKNKKTDSIARKKTVKQANIINTLLGLTAVLMAAPANAVSLSDGSPGTGVYGADFQLFGESTIGSITAKVSRGINPEGTNGSLGAFSEFSENSGVVTIDFNDDATQMDANSYTFGDDSIVYRWNQGGRTGLLNDRWAPSGAFGEQNRSNYLGVFRGNDVTISLRQDLNYFGIGWGAISRGNIFSFYSDDQLISSFTWDDINPSAPVSAPQHGGQGNGYVHFYANDGNGTFNRIVLSQTSGGGFESDNHSFRYRESEFDFETGQDVPFEVESTLGLMLLAMGWIGHRKVVQSKLKRTVA